MIDSCFRFTLKPLPAFVTFCAVTVALVLFTAGQSSSTKTDTLSTAAPAGTSEPSSVFDRTARSGAAYVGYRHKGIRRGEKLANGVTDLGGGLLSDDNYGVTRFSKDGKYMLWLEEMLDHDEDGVPTWEVKDVLVFDKLKKNQMFLFSYSSPCTENGAENLDLIVMVEENRKHKTYTVLKAWRANVVTERFEEAATASVVCPYDIK